MTDPKEDKEYTLISDRIGAAKEKLDRITDGLNQPQAEIGRGAARAQVEIARANLMVADAIANLALTLRRKG